MVTSSVSTRKVERVAATMGIDRMSASQVSLKPLRERGVEGVVQDFLSGKSLVRMLDAVFSEMDEGWESRR